MTFFSVFQEMTFSPDARLSNEIRRVTRSHQREREIRFCHQKKTPSIYINFSKKKRNIRYHIRVKFPRLSFHVARLQPREKDRDSSKSILSFSTVRRKVSLLRFGAGVNRISLQIRCLREERRREPSSPCTWVSAMRGRGSRIENRCPFSRESRPTLGGDPLVEGREFLVVLFAAHGYTFHQSRTLSVSVSRDAVVRDRGVLFRQDLPEDHGWTARPRRRGRLRDRDCPIPFFHKEGKERGSFLSKVPRIHRGSRSTPRIWEPVVRRRRFPLARFAGRAVVGKRKGTGILRRRTTLDGSASCGRLAVRGSRARDLRAIDNRLIGDGPVSRAAVSG